MFFIAVFENCLPRERHLELVYNNAQHFATTVVANALTLSQQSRNDAGWGQSTTARGCCLHSV